MSTPPLLTNIAETPYLRVWVWRGALGWRRGWALGTKERQNTATLPPPTEINDDDDDDHDQRCQWKNPVPLVGGRGCPW